MADPIKPKAQGLRPALRSSKSRQTATVTSPILPGEPGRILWDGSEWLAISNTSNPIDVGELVKIVSRQGGTLMVQPLSTSYPVPVKVFHPVRSGNTSSSISSLSEGIVSAAGAAARLFSTTLKSIASTGRNDQNDNDAANGDSLDLPVGSTAYIADIEKRLQDVEDSISALQKVVVPSPSQSASWIQDIESAFKDDPAFEDIFAYERAIQEGDESLPKTGAELVAYWEKVGVINSRPDIDDSQEYARRLRDQAEHREQT
ncbi:NfeD family protein [Leptolyngbya sp. KIOST-1]|uniref:NfeD family protein n=1 Tax=Leptolyngbya sp. KIOST-1 TaxID=1229172 RepID=UPI0018CF499C|nr:NfeD family protein [Leptolyngbya sp. KIOST-1]